MKYITLIFPHQLFRNPIWLKPGNTVVLLEEFLFFRQYRFHKQKIVLHRAAMQFYADYLHEMGLTVHYVSSYEVHSDLRKSGAFFKLLEAERIRYLDVCDHWLLQRLKRMAQMEDLELEELPSPGFLNTKDELHTWFQGKKRYFQTDFYIRQRQERDILLDFAGNPLGGKWSFDTDNRKRYPKDKTPPKVSFPPKNKWHEGAEQYVKTYFSNNYGETGFTLPITFEESDAWLDQFLTFRFHEFGVYEDAIVSKDSILHHSVLTPMLNMGLITPEQILSKTLKYSEEHSIPLNSTEGFIRQIIGWREFVRGVYHYKGSEERTRNFWEFERKMPAAFYTGTTGILPVDQTIKKILKTGYCHHTERLMILGNFMLLCEIHPDDVYKWFMELFVDAYDWVMVPNVYGMGQFADGGLMSTKPYISGSNYILKMSDFQKGGWQETWDALFWRFMHVHRNFFLRNPRLGMLVRSFDKMPESKQKALITKAEAYLQSL